MQTQPRLLGSRAQLTGRSLCLLDGRLSFGLRRHGASASVGPRLGHLTRLELACQVLVILCQGRLLAIPLDPLRAVRRLLPGDGVSLGLSRVAVRLRDGPRGWVQEIDLRALVFTERPTLSALAELDNQGMKILWSASIFAIFVNRSSAVKEVARLGNLSRLILGRCPYQIHRVIGLVPRLLLRASLLGDELRADDSLPARHRCIR